MENLISRMYADDPLEVGASVSASIFSTMMRALTEGETGEILSEPEGIDFPDPTVGFDFEETEESENDTPDADACPVCTTPYSDPPAGKVDLKMRVECDYCEYTTCRQCVVTYHSDEDSTRMLPGCLKCGKEWTLASLGGKPGLFASMPKMGEISRKRIIASALVRERSMLPDTLQIANVYKHRAGAIEVTTIARSEALARAAKAEISNLNRSIFKPGDYIPPDATRFEPATIGTAKEVFTSLATRLLPKIVPKDAELNTTAARELAALVAGYSASCNGSADDVIREYEARAFIPADSLPRDARRWNIDASSNLSALCRLLSCIPREWWRTPNYSGVVGCVAEYVESGGVIKSDKISTAAFRHPRPSELVGMSPTETRTMGPCPMDGCRGYLYGKRISPPRPKNAAEAAEMRLRGVSGSRIPAALECQLCSSVCCEKCETRVDSEADLFGVHVCNEDTAKSIAAIRETTRPCPQCGTPITRLEGCPHMFCVKCKQPYDWNTNRIQSSNTNPEYHNWVRELREKLVSSGDSQTVGADEIRNAFMPRVVGEDGMTRIERATALRNVMQVSDHPTLSALMSCVVNAEIYLMNVAVAKIAKYGDFENLRIKYLLGSLTEEEWTSAVGNLEMTSFVAQRIVVAVSKYTATVITETTAAYERIREERILDKATRTRIEAAALHESINAAAQCSNATAALGMLGQKKALVRGVFPRAKEFLKVLNDDDTPKQYASLMYGGGNFWFSRAYESERIFRILEIPVAVRKAIGETM